MIESLNKPIEITEFDTSVLELPFKKPVYLPFGRIDTRPSVWVRIGMNVDGRPIVGMAEGTALPMQIPLYDDYSGNIQTNTETILRDIAEQEPKTLTNISQSIKSADLGGNFATARMAVEAALIDGVARAAGRSVVSYLDGGTSDEERHIPYGKSIAENEYDDIISSAREAIDNGARRLKFKVSPDNYGQLYPALEYVGNLFPDIDCMVDANGMFDVENKEHIKMLQSIDGLNLMTIEEPVSRTGNIRGLAAHRALKDTVEMVTPITIDDAIKDANDAEISLDEGLAQIVNLKPGRVGSFLECVRIANYAKSRGSEIMVGGMFEATPGRMMTLTLASYCLSQGFRIPGDVSLPQERLTLDITDRVLYLDDNHNVVFKPKHGWGYES